jgi:hypothetical protein
MTRIIDPPAARHPSQGELMRTFSAAARRLTAGLLAIAAVATVAVLAASPASANLGSTGFGAANMPLMEITEGGKVDVTVSAPPCPAGVECTLTMYSEGATATKTADFNDGRGVDPSRVWRNGDGRIVGIKEIRTVQDTKTEPDEVLWVTARVDYYPGGCPNGRPGSSPSCLPQSSFRWLTPVEILDDDKPRMRTYIRGGWRYVVVNGRARRIGRVHTSPATERITRVASHG